MKKFLKKYGISFRKSEKVWKKVSKEARIGKVSLPEVQRKWIEGIGLGNNELREWLRIDRKIVWGKVVKKFPWVNWMLKNLHKKYKIAVLSDAVEDRKTKRQRMKKIGIRVEFIDKIFTSNDIGVEKPNPKAYFEVIEYFRVKPEEVVFIGHSRDEIDGAKKLGLITVSVKTKYGRFSVKTLREIPKILRIIEKQIRLREQRI